MLLLLLLKMVERIEKKENKMEADIIKISVLDKPLTVRENLKSRAVLYGITGRLIVSGRRSGKVQLYLSGIEGNACQYGQN